MKKLMITVLVFALLLPVLAGCQNAYAKQYTGQSPAQIPPQDAVAAALDDATVTQQEITDLEVELDRDNGSTHYDVEFEKDGKEYEYDIHAESGEILVDEIPKSTTAPKPTDAPKATTAPESTTVQITRQKAIEIALAHAGLTKDQIRDLDAEKDKERGVWLFEVDFEHDVYEYEYDIHAETGEILYSVKEKD